jgi:hypothetical protein
MKRSGKIQSHATVPLRSDGAAVAQPVPQDPAEPRALPARPLRQLLLRQGQGFLRIRIRIWHKNVGSGFFKLTAFC